LAHNRRHLLTSLSLSLSLCLSIYVSQPSKQTDNVKGKGQQHTKKYLSVQVCDESCTWWCGRNLHYLPSRKSSQHNGRLLKLNSRICSICHYSVEGIAFQQFLSRWSASIQYVLHHSAQKQRTWFGQLEPVLRITNAKDPQQIQHRRGDQSA
ncbi:hypothetical protein AMELA_G00140750, partial [Ameiurus melas]